MSSQTFHCALKSREDIKLSSWVNSAIIPGGSAVQQRGTQAHLIAIIVTTKLLRWVSSDGLSMTEAEVLG